MASRPIPALFCGALLMATVFWSLAASAVEMAKLTPYRQAGRLLVNLEARQLLDAPTASTIDSGLPGTCVYRLGLESLEGSVIKEHLLTFSLRLDLWENLYILDGPGGQTSFSSLAAADSAWSRLRDIDICGLDRLTADEEYRLRVQILVQPLGPEQRARLSHYVSSNSGRNRDELALDLGAIFGRLMGGGDGGEDHSVFTSTSFSLGGLEVSP